MGSSGQAAAVALYVIAQVSRRMAAFGRCSSIYRPVDLI